MWSGKHHSIAHSESERDESKLKALHMQARRKASVGCGLVVVAIWLLWTWSNIFKIAYQPNSEDDGEVRMGDMGTLESAKLLLDISKYSKLPNFDVEKVFARYLSTPHLPSDGRDGTAAREFRQEFLEIENAKTRVKTSNQNKLSNNGGCNFRGPEYIGGERSEQTARETLLESLNIPELRKHLQQVKGAQLLSVDDHKLCSWDPTLFLPSLPAFSQASTASSLRSALETNQDADIASAYLFHDVCVTFNIDSSKQAQRGLIMFDSQNDSPGRCVFCPNPQTNVEWSSNPCGMMWLHQGNAKSFSDWTDCYRKNRRRIRENGQRQVPGELSWEGKDTEIKAALYYDRPTLLLQYTKNNPGHQLWDSLFSILTILKSQDFHRVNYFDLVAVHQTPSCPPNTWICTILRKLQAIHPSNAETLEMFPGVLTCFSELIVPVQGWNHNSAFSQKPIVDWLRDKLNEGFGLDKTPQSISRAKMMIATVGSSSTGKASGQTYNLLLYAHNTPGEAGKRRAWLDIVEALQYWKEEDENIQPNYIPDFSKVSIEEQARLFHSADILLMPHGGQFGNIIFSRKNTVAIELTCGGYSHLGLSGGQLAKSLEIYHIVHRPCKCERKTDEGNFYFTPSEFRHLMAWVDTNIPAQQYGSFRSFLPCSGQQP